jgi:microsomal epoxide hydrolase
MRESYYPTPALLTRGWTAIITYITHTPSFLVIYVLTTQFNSSQFKPIQSSSIQSSLSPAQNMSYSPPSTAKQFTLNVPDDAISEWRQLLQLSKLAPDTWEGRQDDRSWGVPRAWLENAKNEWLNTYDWRAEEARINSFPQYKMQIESADMHFVALFSQRADAIPIVFLHGWPGSFIEFLPLCELIRSQYTPQDQPYHIIVPSLPGYTLGAELPKDRAWTLEDSSRVLNSLMKELGFDKYIAQGGDVGSYLARIMAQKYETCVGIHCRLPSLCM